MPQCAVVTDGRESPYCVASFNQMGRVVSDSIGFFHIHNSEYIEVMGERTCCVVSCNVRSQDRQGKKLDN